MAISKTIEIRTHSLEETRHLGSLIGTLLQFGLVIAMTGDLGSGKTSLVQGMARGLDVPEEYYITSPTFTLINEYPGRLSLFHVDLYRLSSPDDFENIGLYDIFADEGVTAVEWAERLADDLPDEHLRIELTIFPDDSRNIRITGYGHDACNLVKELENIYL